MARKDKKKKNKIIINKDFISLDFKLNILITSIILIVSFVLINISYSAYLKINYAQMEEILDDMTIFAEEKKKDILSEASRAYAVTKIDGFEEVRAEAERKDDNSIINEWLLNYMINYTTKEIVKREDYEAYRDDLKREAEKITSDFQKANDWMKEKDPTFFDYYGCDFPLFSLTLSLQSVEDKTDVDSTDVYVKTEDGYMLLANVEANLGGDDYEGYIVYGEYVEEPETIKFYNSSEEEKAKKRNSYIGKNDIETENEEGPVISRVSYYEEDGEKYYLVYNYDAAHDMRNRRRFLLRNILMAIGLVITSIVVSLIILRKIITRPLGMMAEGVDKFRLTDTSDAETEKVEVLNLPIKSKDEIGVLYRNIQSMEKRIIDNSISLTHMAAEKERIGTELNLATKIQADTLPSTFPAFPDRKDFDIYASMDPAKEVGGDFYDYFQLDDDHLVLVIADVSGKGVPAALFMMISKILIENIARIQSSPAEILKRANEQITGNNNEEMFVTVWLGILELSTGKLTASNAGHEYPVQKHANGKFELIKDKHGFVLGVMENVNYSDYELILEPGDKLFVYTDGVPEATNSEKELYGTNRMLEALNKCADISPEKLLKYIRNDVDNFVGEAEQFDDLTMLCLEYHGPENEPRDEKKDNEKENDEKENDEKGK